MKSKIFVGSSIEGLSVAYSIQQNLQHDGDITIWSQGIFNLSETSMESLIEALDNSDFGIFVFTPDDQIKIRGKNHLTVRDNVIFELGLFIGRLGRKRCYIIMPSSKTFHLPSDLMGITPGHYDSNREDNNLLAATGPTCHQIRESMRKIGAVNSNREESTNNTLENDITTNKNKGDDDTWIDALFEEKYDVALESLKKKYKNTRNLEKKHKYRTWICYTEFQIDSIKGSIAYREYIKDFKTNNLPYEEFVDTLISKSQYSEALNTIEEGLKNVKDKNELLLKKAKVLNEIGKIDTAEEILKDLIQNNDNVAKFYLTYINILKECNRQSDAIQIAFQAYKNAPDNVKVLKSFAALCYELNYPELQACLLSKCLEKEPNNIENLGNIGNAYFRLKLYDQALDYYQKANNISKNKHAWILSNIGNVYYQKDLPKIAESYLKEAIKLDENSSYSHDKLAKVLALKSEFNKQKMSIISEAAKRLSSENLEIDDLPF